MMFAKFRGMLGLRAEFIHFGGSPLVGRGGRVGVLCYHLCISSIMAVPRVSLFCPSVVCVWTFPYLAVLFSITP